ncbi:GntR family transcriptional regulator [Spongiactinospora rosea]|uniref:GntR family transcriptional regulator n=1 Tax=Spongiactinospora rosea TaxID=2248750 RepID=A0A366LXT1_9ACTN|nr:TetR/AcrR family transcriptional regulator C-terminal domain-containing protein [Spongiactinospora rosea]RBQ18778.1 GntR family transcriptional regulator [Spongiactinospora rosea]
MRRPDADPPYLRIVAEIKRQVQDGELRAGDRVPSTRQAAARWGVAAATAAKALESLRREGVVVAIPRVGTVVADTAPRAPRSAPPAPATAGGKERERVVRAAIAIADAGGMEAVSMRGVATALDIPTMSLYRHVRGKEELAVLMADTAFGELRLPAVLPPGWRARLELLARLQWRMYGRHPWLPRLVSLTHPQPLPNLVGLGERALGVLADLGLEPRQAMLVWWTVANYVRGTAFNLEQQAESEQHTGLSADEWHLAHLPVFRAGLPSGRLPAPPPHGGPGPGGTAFDLTEFFEFGLRLTLDGIAVLVGRSRRDDH